MMEFKECIKQSNKILMEGALGERLKREYHLTFDENIVMAELIYKEKGALALNNLWAEYLEIAKKYNLPFLGNSGEYITIVLCRIRWFY